jgi:hypothetical protein
MQKTGRANSGSADFEHTDFLQRKAHREASQEEGARRKNKVT